MPWTGDERIELVLDSVDEMAEDIADTMGVSAEMLDSIMKDRGLSSSPSGSPGSSSGTGSQQGVLFLRMRNETVRG